MLSCTFYQLGAFGAVNHLRQVVMYLDIPVLQQPEFYLGKAAERFDEHGNLADIETKKMIEQARYSLSIGLFNHQPLVHNFSKHIKLLRTVVY